MKCIWPRRLVSASRPFAAMFVGAIPSLLAAGHQLTGVYAPAASAPLPPEIAQKKFAVPEGYEVRLFAAEPLVVNPVAMTWDARGRLWVIELFEYPLGAAPGTKPRDCIKILEDTDGDGRADKATVFADGLNLATGLQLGYGGVFVGQAPDLLFLKDTNGDDVADERMVLKTGFALDDRHELPNGFTWGPDGWLYLTHGVFNHSRVRNPDEPPGTGVALSAAVARYQPRTKKFEVFADGTSNPWGVDFDRAGNAFVSACVIDHLFHMAPGGIYVRQAGAPVFPHGYELLPSIVNHRHFRAAYAGVQIYQGNQFPASERGAVFIGNIHDNAIHEDRLTPRGSSFVASFQRDFLRANDGWFRPVSVQVGPDGALWVMDWYDKYPCYQNAQADPEGVDRKYGRIWRVVYTGGQRGKPVPSRPSRRMDLEKLSDVELVHLLEYPNAWQRRMAQRILSERAHASIGPALEKLLAANRNVTPGAASTGVASESRLAALWTLHSAGLLRDDVLEKCSADADPAIRNWSARLTGERRDPSPRALERLRRLASDPDPTVRLAVAVAAREYASGSLTVDTPPPADVARADLGPILAPLIHSSAGAKDPVLPFMIWMAAEPRQASDPDWGLDWLLRRGSSAQPLSGELAKKCMRLICDVGDARQRDVAVRFLSGAFDRRQNGLLLPALDGLLEGQQGKAWRPSPVAAQTVRRLLASDQAEVAERAQRLGALWGDHDAIRSLISKINDSQIDPNDRAAAMRVVAQAKTPAASQALLDLAAHSPSEPLVIEATRDLGQIGGADVGGEFIRLWRQWTPAERRAAADVLTTRAGWAMDLLAAVERKRIDPGELPATALRALAQANDPAVRERARQAIGQIREQNRDKLTIIAEKRAVVLRGPVDVEAGHQAAKKTCYVCHRLYGEGADVGPDLTGVGRSSLDALLANIIDPSQVVGKGYENVEVETKDGQSLSGRMVENTASRVTLLSAGPKESVIARGDIASIHISKLSVMPEGLEQMPDQDFRNLIWFLLNPPQEHRPWTRELKRQLLGEENAPAPPQKRSDARQGRPVAGFVKVQPAPADPGKPAPAPHESAGGGAIVLLARDAIVHGATLRYEPAPNKNCLGYWTDPNDWAGWRFNAAEAGPYEIELWQGCGNGQGGSDARIEAAGESVSFRVEETGHFQIVVPRKLGRIYLPAGPCALAIKAERKQAAAIMDVRQVRLIPSPAEVASNPKLESWLKARRVLFLGDSITYAGGYVDDVVAYIRMRFPDARVEFINLGLPSETVSGLSEPGHAGGAFPRPDLHERLGRALAMIRPDWIAACYGMNDGIYYPFGEGRFDQFKSGIEWLRRQADLAGAKIIFLTPPVFDPLPLKGAALPAGLAEYRQPFEGYNEVLDRYSDWLMAQRQRGWEVIDLHRPMERFLAEQRRANPRFSLSRDGVHPDAQGHWLMAREILRSFGAPKEIVASDDWHVLSAAHPRALKILQRVRARQELLKDAWLTAVGHKRPGMAKGKPLAEAQADAGRLMAQIYADASLQWPGRRSVWFGYDRYDFEADGEPAVVVAPKRVAPGRPWLWEGEFFGHKPEPDLALLGRGFHVIYMQIPGMFGSPGAVAHWDAFYRTLTRDFGLAKRAALTGLSRGGLYAYHWAEANPDKVACIYGDAPARDFGHIALIRKPGVGHHPHGLDDSTPIVNFIWTNAANASAQAWLAGHGGGPLDADGKPLIRKLGTIDLDLVETTPVVFRGRLWRFEWVRAGYWNNARHRNYFRFRDPVTGEATPAFADGHEFGSAFVQGGTAYVTGDASRSRVDMFASDDLKHWRSWPVMDDPRYGIFNTSLWKAGDRFVLMFEIDRPLEEAGAPFTARFAASPDLRHWTLTPPDCNYSKDRYTAPHALRWLDGWYYDFYLEAYHGYETRVVRSRDLIRWTPSPLNPVLRAAPEDKIIANPQLTEAQRTRVAHAVNLNNSDIDFCEWRGRLIINYSWGNQQGVEHLAEAVYDGTLAEFLRGWFPGEP